MEPILVALEESLEHVLDDEVGIVDDSLHIYLPAYLFSMFIMHSILGVDGPSM